jgi:hypothetical protein
MPLIVNLPYKGDATEWIWQSGRRSTSSFTSYFNDLVGLHIWFITIGPSLRSRCWVTVPSGWEL